MILSKAEQVCISIHQDPVNLLYAVNLSLSPHSSSHLMRRLSRAVVCLQGDHRYCLHSLLRSTVGKHFDVHGFSSILMPYRDFYNAELLYQSKIFYLLSCLVFLFNKVYKNTSIQHELLPKFFFCSVLHFSSSTRIQWALLVLSLSGWKCEEGTRIRTTLKRQTLHSRGASEQFSGGWSPA